MKKERRVKKSYEFTRIIQKKQFIKTSSFILYFQPKVEKGNRIGISVGKKLGNAVTRNKVKRQLRAMIDEVFSFEEPFDAIVIVRPEFLNHQFCKLRDELIYARKKALQRVPRKEKL